MRVLVVSEHGLLSQGISLLLRDVDCVDAVHEASDAEAALERIRSSRPDVLLFHLSHPAAPRMRDLRSLRDGAPDVPVVLLLDSVDDDVSVAMQAGAIGCLDKSVDSQQLIEALRDASSGEVAVSPTVARKLARIVGQGERHTEGRSYPAPLTGREAQVLELLAEGLSNREIAHTLFVSESTVRAHLRTVARKLGVSNRVHAVARAMQLGMVSPADTGGDRQLGGRVRRVAS